MKKQFTIKSISLSKNIAMSAAKKESANLLKMFSDDGKPCCYDIDPRFQGLAPKSVFSL